MKLTNRQMLSLLMVLKIIAVLTLRVRGSKHSEARAHRGGAFLDGSAGYIDVFMNTYIVFIC
jgi:hypothetical protein